MALLIPENTRLFWGDGGHPRVGPQTLADEVGTGLLLRFSGESFAGPARIFLLPGQQDWQLEVLTDAGRMSVPFDAPLEAGGRYLIEIDESNDNFEWSLTKLSPQSYRKLYGR